MFATALVSTIKRAKRPDVLVSFWPHFARSFAFSVSQFQKSESAIQRLHIGESKEHFIAYRKFTPNTPCTDVGIIFCQGLMSNMNGVKAKFLDNYCQQRNLKYVCFDYVGHGQSSGKFEDFTISLWKENTLEILGKVAEGTVSKVHLHSVPLICVDVLPFQYMN